MDKLSTTVVTIEATGGLMDQQTTTVGEMAQDEFAITAGAIFNRAFNCMDIPIVLFEILEFVSISIAIAHPHLVQTHGLIGLIISVV